MNGSVLVVDDNRDLARGVALILTELSQDIRVAFTAEEALELLGARAADLVLTDVRMPGADGLSLLRTLRERYPQTRVILLTAFGTIESAVQAMRLGALDYLAKPFDNDELLAIVRRALNDVALEDEVLRLRAELAARQTFCGMVGRDRRMLGVFEVIKKVASSAATVLVRGESGTGKELVAKALHETSGRKGRFVAFNAAAVPEALAEAELFGVKKGAYTGAQQDRKGLFVSAEGGTLFIDEVSSMPMALQGKLLRVLQEREVQPLGSDRAVP
ncbi:MAG: sigma-54-dependent Fis family transcriptional regulator, partial [Deltaproteobacteria bacterium]|nr:sigma-54-dependent Fis family transcriptional regulator [Deltaproteobacteria bacterium]